MRAFRLVPILLLATLALPACDTAEERAEGYYQRALALIAEGDEDRAMVELRNVFRLNGEHHAARLRYARLLRERGEVREALGQYLRLAEQDPENAGGRRELAELALQVQDFAAAEEHADAAYALDPADPAIRALKATVDYRRGGSARAGAVAMARAAAAEAPELVAAQMVLVADRLEAGAPREALGLIDAALTHLPEDEGLHLARLAALETLGDTAGVGDALAQMVARFPDNPGARDALVQWHLQGGDPAGAEAVLRAAAARDPEDPQGALTLVQFLLETGGPDAARAELDRRIAAAADPRPFRRARAGLDFAEGRTEEGIAAMRALLEGAAPSDATRELQVALAEMLAETGATEASGALLAAVLEADRTQVAALKLRAKLAIEADRPEAAIQDLRAALTQAPRDPEIMTIMALAHEREGARELAGERLALAVEASERAPQESLRYARFLMQDGRSGPAEGVIADALRRAPQDPELLDMLGRIHLERRDWPRVGQVAGILRGAGDPEAAARADALEAASLKAQGRTADTIALLEGLAAGGADAAAMAGLVRAQVAAGDPAAAQAYLDRVLAADPASLPGRLLQAGLFAVRGEAAAAEALYRAVLAEAPDLVPAHQAWYTFLLAEGRAAEAAAALEAGLAAAPGDGRLLFLQAGLREAEGDLAGALALYEELYARDTGSAVLANNLASLLTAVRGDAASLARAHAVARRLRGSDVPQFQDTWGWILHLRGEHAAALEALAPAAEALPGDARVQFHHAEAAFALARWEEAAAGYARALAAADAGSPLPQAEAARARLAEIAARPPASAADPEAGSEG